MENDILPIPGYPFDAKCLTVRTQHLRAAAKGGGGGGGGGGRGSGWVRLELTKP